MSEQTETVSICGVLVAVHPQKEAETEQAMLAIEGLEIHERDDSGRLVITIESDSYAITGDRLTALQNIQGVLSASMVYQITEDVPVVS